MKKSFLMLGVAAMALASCTQNEVVEYAENRAIQFDTFVNNNTRAVTDLTTDKLTKFYVFGDYEEGTSIAFSNTEVVGTKEGGNYTPVNPAYWQTGKTYEFGAYSNGNTKLTDVTFTNGTLTISKYSVNDANDLVAATASDISAPSAGEEKSVPLTFKHLLSKVKFTFSTNAVPEAFRMEVSNLTFDGIKTNATCVFSNNTISTDWTGTSDAYTVPTLSDYAVAEGSASTEDILVIPQTNTDITASFTVTIYDQKTGAQIATNNFTASLNSSEKWVEGNVYNYTATINPDKVDGKLKPITFTVEEVSEWNPVTQPTTASVSSQD